MLDEPAATSPPVSGPAPDRPLPVPVITIALIALNVVVFAVTLALGASAWQPSPEQMIDFGGNVAGLTLGDEPWRLCTAMFLHYGVLHVAMNMLGLWSGGFLAERMYGRAGYAALYLLSGLGGGLTTMWHKHDVVAAGASGAIFGVFGAIGAYLLVHRERLDPTALRKQVKGLLFFMGFNLLYGLSEPTIDMSAHLGGLVAGFVVGLALEWRGPRSLARVAVVTVLGLAALAAAIATRSAPAMPPAPAPPVMIDAYREYDRIQAWTTDRYNATIDEGRAGTATDAEVIDRLEHELLPPWRALKTRLASLPPPPARLREVHGALLAYVDGRIEAWTALVELARERSTDAEATKALQARADELRAALDAALGRL